MKGSSHIFTFINFPLFIISSSEQNILFEVPSFTFFMRESPFQTKDGFKSQGTERKDWYFSRAPNF